MGTNEIQDWLTVNGDKIHSMSFSVNEWMAMATICSLAVAAGCPSNHLKTAVEKIKAAHLDGVAKDQWPENIGR